MMSEQSRQLTPMETFQNRVMDKIRADIGEMLPDDVVAGLVQKAIDQQFFQPRTVEVGYRNVERPSWFVEEVAKLAQPILKEKIDQAFLDRKDEIDKAVTDFLSKENLTLLMVSRITEANNGSLYAAAQAISEAAQRLGR